MSRQSRLWMLVAFASVSITCTTARVDAQAPAPAPAPTREIVLEFRRNGFPMDAKLDDIQASFGASPGAADENCFEVEDGLRWKARLPVPSPMITIRHLGANETTADCCVWQVTPKPDGVGPMHLVFDLVEAKVEEPVLTPKGIPIPGIGVVLALRTPSRAYEGVEKISYGHKVTTNPEGDLPAREFLAGEYQVILSAIPGGKPEGYVEEAGMRLFPESYGKLRVNADGTCKVEAARVVLLDCRTTVEVVRQEGVPIVGAKVRLHASWHGGDNDIDWEGVTDMKGNYSTYLPCVPDLDWTATLESKHFGRIEKYWRGSGERDALKIRCEIPPPEKLGSIQMILDDIEGIKGTATTQKFAWRMRVSADISSIEGLVVKGPKTFDSPFQHDYTFDSIPEDGKVSLSNVLPGNYVAELWPSWPEDAEPPNVNELLERYQVKEAVVVRPGAISGVHLKIGR